MAALTMCCAAVVFNASILAWIISRRRTNLALQLAQPTALALMTFGGIVTSSGIGWLIGDNRQINCVMRPATLAIGFSLGFGAIWLKLRRVEAVCAHEAALLAHTRRRAAPEGGGGGPDKPPAKPASTTEKRLLQLLGLIVLGDLAILGLWFAIDPSVPTDTMRDVHGITVPAVECVGGANPFQGILWAYKMVVVIAGCRSARRVRELNLGEHLDESQKLAMAMNQGVPAVVVCFLAYHLTSDDATFVLFTTFAANTVAISTVATLVLPRVMSDLRPAGVTQTVVLDRKVAPFDGADAADDDDDDAADSSSYHEGDGPAIGRRASSSSKDLLSSSSSSSLLAAGRGSLRSFFSRHASGSSQGVGGSSRSVDGDGGETGSAESGGASRGGNASTATGSAGAGGGGKLSDQGVALRYQQGDIVRTLAGDKVCEVTRFLGRGAFGEVFLVRNRHRGWWAMKSVRWTGDKAARRKVQNELCDEIRVMLALGKHANLVALCLAIPDFERADDRKKREGAAGASNAFMFGEDESSVLADGDAGEVAGGGLLRRGARGAQLEVEVGMLVMMDVAPHGLDELIKDGRFYRLDEYPMNKTDAQRLGASDDDAARARKAKLFAELDENSDGELSRDEVMLGAGKLGMSVGDADALFQELDENGDGVLSLDEFDNMAHTQFQRFARRASLWADEVLAPRAAQPNASPQKAASAAAVASSLGVAGVAAGFDRRAEDQEAIDDEVLQDRCLDALAQIAAGLAHMHAVGFMHADLKPANCRVTPDGVVKLCDFGFTAPWRTSASDRAGEEVVALELGSAGVAPSGDEPPQQRCEFKGYSLPYSSPEIVAFREHWKRDKEAFDARSAAGQTDLAVGEQDGWALGVCALDLFSRRPGACASASGGYTKGGEAAPRVLASLWPERHGGARGAHADDFNAWNGTKLAQHLRSACDRELAPMTEHLLPVVPAVIEELERRKTAGSEVVGKKADVRFGKDWFKTLKDKNLGKAAQMKHIKCLQVLLEAHVRAPHAAVSMPRALRALLANEVFAADPAARPRSMKDVERRLRDIQAREERGATLVNLGVAYHRLALNNDAQTAYEDAIRGGHPKHASVAYCNLAVQLRDGAATIGGEAKSAAEDDSKLAEVRKLYEKALEHDHNNQEAFASLSQLASHQGHGFNGAAYVHAFRKSGGSPSEFGS